MILAMNTEVAELIEIHSAAGRRFEADGVRSFVREQGEGANVVLLHGVPASSFLYRKVIPQLADQGLRAIAFDFPGLGLADRPQPFDYSWSGLARWLGEAIDALGIDRCHLVVHDIGGPIGCEWAVRNPDRMLSLTALNTDLSAGRLPPPLDDAAIRQPRRSASSGCAPPRPPCSPPSFAFRASATARRCRWPRSMSIASCSCASIAAVPSCRSCAASSSRRKSSDCLATAWPTAATRRGSSGASTIPALGLDHMAKVQRVLGVDDPVLLPAKHFLQEDQSGPVAYTIADQVAPLG